MKLWQLFTELFYPSVCMACGASVPDYKDLFCARCATEVAFTDFKSLDQNEMINRLISARRITMAFAPFYYKKNETLRQLFYKIKYGNRPDIAIRLAQYAGERLKSFQSVLSFKAITFVPIHPKKQAKRGYNQSEIIADTLGEIFNVPVIPCLHRTSNIDTQTHFGRLKRLENQHGSIRCDPDLLKYNSVMIVDDILTTGATLETCYDAMMAVHPDLNVSVLTLAMADDW